LLLIESEQCSGLSFAFAFVFDAFLEAKLCPPCINRGAGFRSKALLSCLGDCRVLSQP
jgi:hypothetical protein